MRLKLWQAFCASLEQPLPVIAILISDYHGTEEQIVSTAPILRGAVHHLERGEPLESRPMIQALAQYLADLAGKEMRREGKAECADG